MPSAQTTKFSVAQTVGAFTVGGLLTAATIAMTTGFTTNVIFDSSNVSAPALTLDTTSFFKYNEVVLSDSGSYHMNACILNPYTGTGLFHKIAFECNTTGNAATVNGATVSNQYSTGTNIFSARSIFTGSTLVTSGATLLGEWENDKYVCVSTTTGATTDQSCKLKIWSSEHFDT